jgi:protein kinase C substrate 80K-H
MLMAQFVKLAREAEATDKAVEIAKELAKTAAQAAGTDVIGAQGAVSWPAEAEAGAGAAATPSAETDELDAEIRKLEADKRTAEADRSSADKDSVTDFGPDHAFYPLKDKCVELKIAQYTYKVCPFDSARQDHVNLGTFGGWKEGSDHSVMEFTGGQQCWNGPTRSLTLTLECGSEDALLQIDEPSKCAYSARMSTPAACDRTSANELRLELGEPGTSAKDEL